MNIVPLLLIVVNGIITTGLCIHGVIQCYKQQRFERAMQGAVYALLNFMAGIGGLIWFLKGW